MQKPKEKIEYYIAHRCERENQILEVLRNNPTESFDEMDIVKEIYIDTPEKLLKAAAYNVNHHLVKLSKENRVKQMNGFWQYKDFHKNMM